MALIKEEIITETKTTSKKYIYYDVDDTTEDPVEDPVVDEFATAPDFTTDNRVPEGTEGAGNVIVPYAYAKNNWDIVYNLDISKRNAGEFYFKINPQKTYKDLVPQCILHFQKKVDGYQEIILKNTKGVKWMTPDEFNEFDVKACMTSMNPALPYDISTWCQTTGDDKYKTYIFLRTTETDGKTYHYSNAFYIFPMDDGSGYDRI